MRSTVPGGLRRVTSVPSTSVIGSSGGVGTVLLRAGTFAHSRFSQLLFGYRGVVHGGSGLSPRTTFSRVDGVLFVGVECRHAGSKARVFSGSTFAGLGGTCGGVGSGSTPRFCRFLFRGAGRSFTGSRLFSRGRAVGVQRGDFRRVIGRLRICGLSAASSSIGNVTFRRFLKEAFHKRLKRFFAPHAVISFVMSILSPRRNRCIYSPYYNDNKFLVHTFRCIHRRVRGRIRMEGRSIGGSLFASSCSGLPGGRRRGGSRGMVSTFDGVGCRLSVGGPVKHLHSLSFSYVCKASTGPHVTQATGVGVVVRKSNRNKIRRRSNLLGIGNV